jgi:hypothetical protein
MEGGGPCDGESQRCLGGRDELQLEARTCRQVGEQVLELFFLDRRVRDVQHDLSHAVDTFGGGS